MCNSVMSMMASQISQMIHQKQKSKYIDNENFFFFKLKKIFYQVLIAVILQKIVF